MRWWGPTLLAGLLALASCVAPGSRRGFPESFRLHTVLEEGDAARRASVRLVLEGLDADAEGRPDTATGLYERALQVDPTNPWAYLAIARQRVDGLHPEQAIPVLDQTRALLEREGPIDPLVEAHLVGLRGAALLASGSDERGSARLRQARELSPSVWSDGRLDPWELR